MPSEGEGAWEAAAELEGETPIEADFIGAWAMIWMTKHMSLDDGVLRGSGAEKLNSIASIIFGERING